MSKQLLEIVLEPEPAQATESPSERLAPSPPEASTREDQPLRLDGVVIGTLVDLADNSEPRVDFPGNPKGTAIAARSTAALSREDIGQEIALLFEGGDPARPLVIGRIQHPEESTAPVSRHRPVFAEMDDERLVLSAGQEIVLRCGKASITLTKAGKILIRGAYLLSRSSGVNRIKGGSVQIN